MAAALFKKEKKSQKFVGNILQGRRMTPSIRRLSATSMLSKMQICLGMLFFNFTYPVSVSRVHRLKLSRRNLRDEYGGGGSVQGRAADPANFGAKFQPRQLQMQESEPRLVPGPKLQVRGIRSEAANFSMKSEPELAPELATQPLAPALLRYFH